VNGDLRPATGDGDHDRYEVLAAGWAVHALEPDDEAEFAAHLARCAACRHTVADLEATVGELAFAAPAVEPPPGLLDRIHAAVEAEEAHPRRGSRPGGEPSAQVVPLRPRRGLRERAAWIVAVAAVLALLALGAWNVSLQREVGQQRQVVAEREALLRELVQPGRRMAAQVPYREKGPPVAYVLSRGDELEVVTSGMSPNTPGRETFWLWGQWGQRRVPLGRFDVGTGDMALHAIGAVPLGMDDVDAFAVSVEPGAARPVTPTRIVAVGGVDA
jgi:hypothetical protein